jgi:hypothetical protein
MGRTIADFCFRDPNRCTIGPSATSLRHDHAGMPRTLLKGGTAKGDDLVHKPALASDVANASPGIRFNDRCRKQWADGYFVIGAELKFRRDSWSADAGR